MGCSDPAARLVDVFCVVMGEAFGADAVCPPVSPVSRVWLMAGDGSGLPVTDCEPVAWVRISHRYRSLIDQFPAGFQGAGACGLSTTIPVLAVEVGIARCTSMEVNPDWAVLRDEAVTGLDDSWRLAQVLCGASKRLRSDHLLVATDTIAPSGPSGGMIAWTGMAYVQIPDG